MSESEHGSLKLVGGIYYVGRKLGSGSFGEIYSAVNSETGEELAVKCESARDSAPPMLQHEANLIKHLQGVPGIARMHYCDVEGDQTVMVMDRLGPSLEDLFHTCGRRFSLKTVLMLADQILYRVEHVHNMRLVHRDIKPSNFLIGREEGAATVYMIDFGLAKPYQHPKSKRHIPYCEKKSLTGTARYASVNAHVGAELSRRDDLESVGYMLMYFVRGNLPWQGIQASTRDEKYLRILDRKRSLSVSELCQGHPPVFAAYLRYCRELRFADRPDYGYLRRLFKDVFIREGFTRDGLYDWLKPKGTPTEARDTAGRPKAATRERRCGGEGDSTTEFPPSAHPGCTSGTADGEIDGEPVEPVARSRKPRWRKFRCSLGCLSTAAAAEA